MGIIKKLLHAITKRGGITYKDCLTPVKKDRVGKIKTVLILGNSIVRHGPAPHIGWNGDWGMAATSRENDFVHILKAKIKALDESVQVNFANIADFERDYQHFDFTGLNSLKNPDMLIMKISENVNDTDNDEFIIYYDSLLNYIDPNGKAVRIIADGFWKKNKVNSLIREYAANQGYSFIGLSSLSEDKTNTAAGQYHDEGINGHPGNKGMKAIAGKIWNAINPYFK